MQFTEDKKIKFICEHDGEIEQEFKSAVCTFIKKNNFQVQVRAYLVRVVYDNLENEFNVALCFHNNANQKILLDGTTKIFKEIFGAHEHLDILFLDHPMEIKIRKIACPFYISDNNQFDVPDFYLTSSENYDLESIRNCFKRKKLIGSNTDGYMLCDISPVIIGQEYSLGENNISRVILVSRYKKYSLFPITAWPAYVHVAQPLKNNIDENFIINDSDVKLIGWGEIHIDKKDIILNNIDN